MCSSSPILASEVVHFMLKNSWLLMSAHLCPLIRTKSVHILHKAVTSLEKSSPLRKQLLEMILGVIFGFSQLEAQKVILNFILIYFKRLMVIFYGFMHLLGFYLLVFTTTSIDLICDLDENFVKV